MASSPRTGRTSVALAALLVGAVLILGVVLAVSAGFNFIAAGEGIASSFFPPEAITDRGARIRELYVIVFAIAAVIFFVVEGLIIWSVVRYRRKKDDVDLPPQTHGNAVAEVVWTVVPTLIVAFMFVISWQTLSTVEAVSPQPQLKVRAVGAQFLWTFEYMPADYQPSTAPDAPPVEPLYTQTTPLAAADGSGGLVLPTGRSIQVYLESPDVIHAFYVPRFLFKKDVVPGRVNTFEFTIDEKDAGGTFHGQCAELCGVSHNAMQFDVVAISGADFDAWLERSIAEANASPPPPPSGEPAPSGQPGGPPPLAIAALDVAFDTSSLSAPADTPFKIDFDNQDANIPHNVAIHEGSPTGPEVFRGEVFPGPAKMTYDVPALPAGAYGFICSVHPTMTGTLTVQ
jgi:cytochrome c oxidase subunit 2